MYIVLLILLTILFILTTIDFNKEILAPAVVVVLMFLFTAAAGLVRWKDWELWNYSIEAVGLLMVGLISFLVGAIFPRVQYRSSLTSKVCEPIRRERIEISRFLVFIFIAVGVFANISYYFIMKQIVGGLGFSLAGISEIINHFRNITSSTYFEGMYSVPGYAKLIYWTLTSIGIFTLIVFLHNLSFRLYKKRDLKLLIVTLLWIILMLLNSHRSYILTALAVGIYSLYFFLNTYLGWNDSVNRKILSIGIRLFILVIVLFVLLAVALGRYESVKSMNITDYITVYMSSGIRNFDLFIKEPIKRQGFGLETFTSLFRTINNRLNLGYTALRPELEFRYINGLKISNVYTAFRRYYSDFGFAGISIIPLTMGYFFSLLYEKIKLNSKRGMVDFNLFLFLYLSKSLFQMCIEETFLLTEVSLNGLYKIFVLYLLYIFIVKKKIRIKFRG